MLKKNSISICCLGIVVFLFSFIGHAQAPKISNNPIVDSTQLSFGNPEDTFLGVGNAPPIEMNGINSMTNYELYLSIAVLVFGILIFIAELYVIQIKRIHPDRIVKFMTVTLIIIGTLYLITAGYTNNQIAPAVGLFGTIAGYLLGRPTSTKPDENTDH